MGSTTRIGNVLSGIMMLLIGVILVINPESGFITVGAILAFVLMSAGLRRLIYYFTMARHMVGGRKILYIGLLQFDMGVFAGGLARIPKIYIMLYLLGGYAFSGAVYILRAFEEKRFEAPHWKRTLRRGIFDIVIAIACLLFYGSEEMMVYIYCIGLIHSAFIRIASAFKRTAVVYIQ